MGRRTNSKVNSFKAMSQALQDKVKDFTATLTDDVIEMALEDLAEQVLDRSLTYVPYDEGDLYESGRMTDVVKTNGTWKVKVMYGTDEVNYAFFVHEDMPRGMGREYSPAGTGPKYLEKAGDEILTDRNIKEAFRKALNNLK